MNLQILAVSNFLSLSLIYWCDCADTGLQTIGSWCPMTASGVCRMYFVSKPVFQEVTVHVIWPYLICSFCNYMYANECFKLFFIDSSDINYLVVKVIIYMFHPFENNSSLFSILWVVCFMQLLYLYIVKSCIKQNANSTLNYYFQESRHVKQNAFMGVLRNMWKIMRVQEWQGDVKQQGGAYIIGPGKSVRRLKIWFCKTW